MKRILIIDDEKDLCEVMSEFFKEYAGVETKFTTNLTSLAEEESSEKYDFIFLDIGIVQKEVEIKDFIKYLENKHQATVITMTGQLVAESDLFKTDKYFYADAVKKIATGE